MLSAVRLLFVLPVLAGCAVGQTPSPGAETARGDFRTGANSICTQVNEELSRAKPGGSLAEERSRLFAVADAFEGAATRLEALPLPGESREQLSVQHGFVKPARHLADQTREAARVVEQAMVKGRQDAAREAVLVARDLAGQPEQLAASAFAFAYGLDRCSGF